MKKILFTIFALFLFTGCTTKINEIFAKDKTYIKLTQYTQRGAIIKSLETDSLINATYLNPILSENNETKNFDIFIIGVYNANDYRGYEKGGINNPDYNLTLNDQPFIKATKADIIKLNLKEYPFYNNWMKYYKVYFNKTTSSILTLKYTHKNIGSTTLQIERTFDK